MEAVDRHEQQSQITRNALLRAALREFSEHGFDGASTRRIATEAGCHQPQINYHFASKRALWESAVTTLFVELEQETVALERLSDPVERFRAMVQRFVVFAARHPELNRIMVSEAMAATDRLTWLVDTYTRVAHTTVLANWRAVRAAGHGTNIDERLVYHLFVGASSLLWANAAEAKLLDPSLDPDNESLVAAHAEAIISMFLPDIPVTSKRK